MSATNGLNSLIREVAGDNPDEHPHKLAQMVAEATDPADLHKFYVSALEPLVGDVIRASRNSALNSKQGRSAKLERRASWWQRILRERVHVGESAWKALGDCTEDDLFFCISERRDQMAAIEGQVRKYEAIVAAMRQHGAETVADLPEGAVEL